MISDKARTVLVITIEPSFSALISELMLQAGIQTIRFARSQEAAELARNLPPDLIFIHMPRGCPGAGLECYQELRSDSAFVSIPILFYTPPEALIERTVGAQAERQVADQQALSDMLIGRIGSLPGAAFSSGPPAAADPSEYAFPRGRDDL